MKKVFGILAVFAAILTFAGISITSITGCGGGSSPTPTPTPALALSPSAVAVPIGGSQAFSTTLSSPTWSVNGPGTISQTGVYQAPGTFPSPNGATVTASAGGQIASASVTVVFPNNNASNQTAPVLLGTSGGNVNDNSTDGKACCIGTLGSLLNRGGTLFILSNNHVLARSTLAANGELIDQPGQAGCPPGSQGLTVATLSQQAKLKPTATSNGHAPDNVDAAIAQIVVGTVDTNGTILDLGPANGTSVAALPPASTPLSASIAIASHPGVAKSGRTTGLTCSTLQAALVDGVQVSYDQSCGGAVAFTALFDGQLVINGGTFSAGGDSGSLVVTSDTAQPVGLLYGGNSASTVANTILDAVEGAVTHPGVLSAFNNGTAPTIVGGGTHAVSCVPTGQASAIISAQSAISPRQQQIVSAVRDRHAAQLMAGGHAIESVKAGASADSPGEGALLIEVSAAPASRVPAVIEGIRTRVIYPDGTVSTTLAAEEFNRGLAAKANHRSEYVGQHGIQGYGIGRSDDAPGETAIVIYTIRGASHPYIPPVLDGVRTKIVEGEPFRASHWNPKLESAAGSCSKAQQKLTGKLK